MNHLLVDRNADPAGEAAVAEKRTLAIVLTHQLPGQLVDLTGRPARADLLGQGLQDRGRDLARDAHAVNLALGLDRDAGMAGHGVKQSG